MNISVFGMGYVGIVTAACFADQGHKVIGVDVSKEKIDEINGAINVEPKVANTGKAMPAIFNFFILFCLPNKNVNGEILFIISFNNVDRVSLIPDVDINGDMI